MLSERKIPFARRLLLFIKSSNEFNFQLLRLSKEKNTGISSVMLFH